MRARQRKVTSSQNEEDQNSDNKSLRGGGRGIVHTVGKCPGAHKEKEKREREKKSNRGLEGQPPQEGGPFGGESLLLESVTRKAKIIWGEEEPLRKVRRKVEREDPLGGVIHDHKSDEEEFENHEMPGPHRKRKRDKGSFKEKGGNLKSAYRWKHLDSRSDLSYSVHKKG